MAIDLLGKVPDIGDGGKFPSARSAKANGLVATGGSISVATLKEAMSLGLYPLCQEKRSVTWWSPDPRGLFFLDRLLVSSRRKSKLKALPYGVALNKDFKKLIVSCAECGQRRLHQWMSEDLQKVYWQLAQEGRAFSVSVYLDENIVGGIFGFCVTETVFTAVSMFHRASQAGTLALVTLLERLKEREFKVVDIQKLSDHTARFGAWEVPREQYLELLGSR